MTSSGGHSMKTAMKVAMAAAGLGFAVGWVRQSRARADTASCGDRNQRNRWRAVTVNKPVGEVAPNGSLPPPLAALGDSVEVRVTTAGDGKGTEIGARLRSPEPSGLGAFAGRLAGRDPRQPVRAALRESKQLLEVGEVLRVEPQPAGHRTTDQAGKMLDSIIERAGAEGVL